MENDAVVVSAAQESFVFAGREFKLLQLDYESYLEFMTCVQPILEAVTATFTSMRGINLPGLDVPAPTTASATSAVLNFCRKDLPALACIVCNQQAIQEGTPKSKVTPEWVKNNAQDPFELVTIITKQIVKSDMIKKFSEFIRQTLPLMANFTGSTPAAQ